MRDLRGLTKEFNGMIRNFEGEKLEEAEGCVTPAMRRSASSRKDLRVVEAGLTEEWSNGPVEELSTGSDC